MPAGKERLCLRGHEKAVSTISFSPDGKILVSGSKDLTVRLWSVATGKQLHIVRNSGEDEAIEWGRDEPASHGCFSPDGRTVALATSRRSVQLLQSVGFGLKARYEGCKYPVSRAGFTPDGDILVASGESGAIYLWDTATAKRLPQFARERVRIMDYFGGSRFAVSPDGTILAVGSLSSPVQLWELATGAKVCEFDSRYHGSADEARALAFAPDGKTLASAGNGDFAILSWDITGLAGRGEATATRRSDCQGFWNDLAAPEADRAYNARWELIAGGEPAVAFIEQHLRPAPVLDPEHIKALLDQLDSNRFAIRAGASQELESLAESAEPLLRAALRDSPSLEKRHRLEAILNRLPAERIRAKRALSVLFNINTPGARSLLTRLAKGAPQAPVTEEAKASLKRLGRRQAAMLPRYSRWAVVGLCLALAGTAESFCLGSQPSVSPPAAEMEKMIARLGNKAFAERERASKALGEVGQPALEALRKAARESKDAEIRARAAQLVQQIENRLDSLLVDYRAYGLPMPSKDAKLVRYICGGGGGSNGKQRDERYCLGFLVKSGNKKQPSTILLGTFEYQPSWETKPQVIEPEKLSPREIDTLLARDGAEWANLALAIQCKARAVGTGWPKQSSSLISRTGLRRNRLVLSSLKWPGITGMRNYLSPPPTGG
jgi:hypothetical protein